MDTKAFLLANKTWRKISFIQKNFISAQTRRPSSLLFSITNQRSSPNSACAKINNLPEGSYTVVIIQRASRAEGTWRMLSKDSYLVQKMCVQHPTWICIALVLVLPTYLKCCKFSAFPPYNTYPLQQPNFKSLVRKRADLFSSWFLHETPKASPNQKPNVDALHILWHERLRLKFLEGVQEILDRGLVKAGICLFSP